MPKILIEQWIGEIQSKLRNVSVFNYNSADKKRSYDLDNYDIVLVSYETVRADLEGKQYKKNLFEYNWLRIILDEANKISNKDNKTTKAIY